MKAMASHLNAMKAKGKLKTTPKMQSKMHAVMHEFKTGQLHSGSKSGPRVTNRKQAIAIAYSEARRKGK